MATYQKLDLVKDYLQPAATLALELSIAALPFTVPMGAKASPVFFSMEALSPLRMRTAAQIDFVITRGQLNELSSTSARRDPGLAAKRKFNHSCNT